MEKTARCIVRYSNGKYETDSLSVRSPTGVSLYLWLHKDSIPEEAWVAIHSIQDKAIAVRKARWAYECAHREELKLGSDSRLAVICYMHDTFGARLEEVVELNFEEMRLFKLAVDAPEPKEANHEQRRNK